MTATIPSAFRPFDSRVTDADQFLNARDVSTFWQNHNVLLAHKARHTLLCATGRSGAALGSAGEFPDPSYFRQGYAPIALAEPTVPPLVEAWVWLPPLVRTLTIRVRAKCGDDTNPPRLYARCSTADDVGEILGDTMIDVVDETVTTYTGQVSVPDRPSARPSPALISIYAETPLYGVLLEDKEVPANTEWTIDDYGPGWIVAAGAEAAFTVGTVVYVTTSAPAVRPEIAPRQIVSITGDKFNVDGFWTGQIIRGSDMIRGQTPALLYLLSVFVGADAYDPSAEVLR